MTQRLALAFALAASVTGCWSTNSGVYCQSGPRYGTQCYSAADLRAPGQASPSNPDPVFDR